MGEMDIPTFMGCNWAADISGPYNEILSGNKYILTFIRLYSSYIGCFAIPDKCSDTILFCIDWGNVPYIWFHGVFAHW